MVIDVIGIIEDGSPRGPNVPASARQSISIVQGADVVLRLKLVKSDGAPYAPSTGEYLWSFRKKNNGIRMRRSGVPTPNIADGSVTFVLTGAETAALKAGIYIYDVWLTDGGVTDAVIPLSELVVENSLKNLDGAITESPPIPESGITPTQGQVVTNVDFTGSVDVGDILRIVGPPIDGRLQTAKADPTNVATMPVVGLLLAKSSATTGQMISSGIYDGLTGLIPGKMYGVGIGGTLISAPVFPASGETFVWQPVGFALSTTELLVSIMAPTVLRG